MRPGTEALDLADLMAAQGYRLAGWRSGRVLAELPPVLRRHLAHRRAASRSTTSSRRPTRFSSTCCREGSIDGLRIDHPDGLADPGGYLDRLAAGHRRRLGRRREDPCARARSCPTAWRCAGTTGYDALLRVQQVLTDPTGWPSSTGLWQRHDPAAPELAAVVTGGEARRRRHRRSVRRSTGSSGSSAGCGRTRTSSPTAAASPPLLVSMDRYRAYLVPGEPAPPEQVAVLRDAVARARVDASTRPTTSRWPTSSCSLLGEDQLSRRDPHVGRCARRTRRPLPADVWSGHGQGHRGHRLLPLVAAGGRQRGRRPPRGAVDGCRRVPHRARARRLASWPVVDDDPVDPRHQAIRGRPCPSVPCSPSARGTGSPWVLEASRLGAPHRPRAGRPAHRVPRLADPRRDLAHRGRAAHRLPPQGRPRGQGAHGLGRRGRGIRGRGDVLRDGAHSPIPTSWHT